MTLRAARTHYSGISAQSIGEIGLQDGRARRFGRSGAALNKRRAQKARRLFLAFSVARGWQGNNLK